MKTVLVVLLWILDSSALELDQCKGMSKAMKRMKCEKVVDKPPEDWDMIAMKEKLNHNLSSVVQDQYTDLPYPAFSLFDMVREQNYYALTPDSHSRPMFYQHTNSLNILNHYLYKVTLMNAFLWIHLLLKFRASKCLMRTSPSWLPVEEQETRSPFLLSS